MDHRTRHETSTHSVQRFNTGVVIAVVFVVLNQVTEHTNANSPMMQRERSLSGRGTEFKKIVWDVLENRCLQAEVTATQPIIILIILIILIITNTSSSRAPCLTRAHSALQGVPFTIQSIQV